MRNVAVMKLEISQAEYSADISVFDPNMLVSVDETGCQDGTQSAGMVMGCQHSHSQCHSPEGIPNMLYKKYLTFRISHNVHLCAKLWWSWRCIVNNRGLTKP